MYSQNTEEQVILDAFGGATAPGVFLDIGASDGKTFSNTLRLVELGWSGVLVEPSPNGFPKLLELHGDNPKLALVNVALARQPGLVKFYNSQEDGGLVSSCVEAHATKWSSDKIHFRSFYLVAMDLAWLFHSFPAEYSFVNLDVESLNWDLFQDLLPLLTPSVKVLCVEHDGHDTEMVNMAIPLGFTLRVSNQENIILTRP